MKHLYKAYESNNGTISLFALDGERNVVWGAAYEQYDGVMSAKDWCLLLKEERDPVEDGWEFGLFDNLNEVAEDYKCLCKFTEERLGGAEIIASSEWREFLPLGIDTETSLGATGKEFVEACRVMVL